MSVFIVSQVLVTIALVVEGTAMQMKQKQHLLVLLSLSCLFNGVHYFLLGQATAGFIFLLSSVRFLINLRWQSFKLAIFFLSMSVGVTFFTYTGLLSLLGLSATVFITMSGFCKDKKMRILMVIGGSIWLVHNIILLSPVAILLELCFVVSGVVGLYRHYRSDAGTFLDKVEK
ncbi:YgjV family protein [Pseudoalteromonas luteoviolacea]|uniref:YgjV family protein n=1 Tax=Pseudoalteromonas luteoviolacea TaxID=43657 RepID=UPI001B381338|nr:YgjV family protein [Pseudoalteromonas luteoviolacea]MBQ4810038.1 YgjV family protein [Pseudoalteromonas luteoviolacea]